MDALSLAALGSVALTEGIKFLYDQAGELLKWRRERTESAGGEDTPPVVAQPEQLPAPDSAQVERFETEMRGLRTDLHEYVSGVDPIDPSDEHLLRLADALRRVLESVYGIPVSFTGESSAAPVVRGSIDADQVAGYVAAVRADRAEGSIEGHTRVHEVTAGGEAIGVDLGGDRGRGR
ncbi:hypothetical protein [Nocardia mexicana]|uniref:Uncharacterized protein n=1 Tax=Nocardia mexicana TaxID=279262 RepID=A0A370HFK0_9NOCA|nr:hypothetical protein [Nocardia mexicana]RDI53944.1 hypothetical protein DFR68_10264 [Nocardia mexicana]